MRAAMKYPLVVGARVAGVLVASDAEHASRPWIESEVTLMEGSRRRSGARSITRSRSSLQDEMVERLGVLDRAKNDFLAEVSRELRGPLASVLGYIELLTDDSADATRRAAPHAGHRRAQRRAAARAHRRPVDDVAHGSGHVRTEARTGRSRRVCSTASTRPLAPRRGRPDPCCSSSISNRSSTSSATRRQIERALQNLCRTR